MQCPLLALWGSKGKIGQWYDALAVWRQYCSAELTGGAVNSGHYLAEEAPGRGAGAFPAVFWVEMSSRACARDPSRGLLRRSWMPGSR